MRSRSLRVSAVLGVRSRAALAAAAIAATACGDSAESDGAEPAPSLTAVPYAGEALLRRGTKVDGFCAARRGSLTAIGAIERGELRVYTSSSAALERQSFSAGPLLATLTGLTDCALVAAGSGFTIAWSSRIDDSSGASVLRLSNDGSPLGEALVIAGHDRRRVALAASDERIYLGRLLDEDDLADTAVWLDTLEGDQVASELLDTCASPSLPVILPRPDAPPDVFYTCQRDESSELVLSSVRDGARARAVVAVGASSLPDPPLAAIEGAGRWIAAWATASGEPAQLLSIEKESLQVEAQPIEASRGDGATQVWSLDLGASSTGSLSTLKVCSEAEGSVECWTDVCSLPSANTASRCTRLELPDASELLVHDGGATLAYLELADDAASDLFTLALDASGLPAGFASPVLQPGWLEPRRLSCFESTCSVFGREGGSRALGVERRQYGFWTLADTNAPALPATDVAAFAASDEVVESGFWDWDWSVASAFRGDAGARLGVFVSGGVIAEHELGELGRALGLFREDYGGASRYRLFEGLPVEAASGIAERVLDAGVSERRSIADRPLQLVSQCAGGYIAIDDERRLYEYRPDTEQVFTERGRVPERGAGGRELLRCLGQRAVGLVYSSSGMLLYREQANGTFREWRFGDVEADTSTPTPPPNAPFGAVAGRLSDGRAVFVVQPPGGFEVSLAALALGEDDEPQLLELERPEPWLISAASVPDVAPPGVVLLAWTDLASRNTWLSRWSLPVP